MHSVIDTRSKKMLDSQSLKYKIANEVKQSCRASGRRLR